jgi:hypothetical protein
METLTCTTTILLISASFLAWTAVCEIQFDRLEARGSGRRTANSVFDRLEARGSGRTVVRPVLA